MNAIVNSNSSIKIGKEETAISITYNEAFKYANIFFCIKKEWEDSLIFTQGDQKIIIEKIKGKNNKKRKTKEECSEFIRKDKIIIMRISVNDFDYIVSNLMYYSYFKKARIDHIHVGCYNKNLGSYDLTFCFEDHNDPVTTILVA